ncbi:hypothetical protein EJB05_56783, partial [Eragrostis curvula]
MGVYVFEVLIGTQILAGSRKLNPTSTKVSARRFYRPDDISSAKAYASDIRELPSNVMFMSMLQKTTGTLKKNKGKHICDSDQAHSSKWLEVPIEDPLATLDIFAGCGGLSEGLPQAAGEAFSKNHPEAVIFIDNCNVILKAIMDKCGDADDSISTSEAVEANFVSRTLDKKRLCVGDCK